MRIAAVGDLHCGKNSHGVLQPVFAKVAEMADVLLLAGDLTNYGTPEEIEVLTGELRVLGRMPIIAVLGNHDYESDQQDSARKILEASGVTVLDGEAQLINGVGFAGVKGFIGGFGRRSLAPWGEKAIKNLVREGMEEALKLESAMAKIRDEPRVVLLHYAPIAETIAGEPPEIAPFLGSSRLEEAIDRYRATVVFHGHAHHGYPEGKTKAGIPVFNVAMPLLKQYYPDQPPFRIYEVALPAGVNPAVAPAAAIG